MQGQRGFGYSGGAEIAGNKVASSKRESADCRFREMNLLHQNFRIKWQSWFLTMREMNCNVQVPMGRNRAKMTTAPTVEPDPPQNDVEPQVTIPTENMFFD